MMKRNEGIREIIKTEKMFITHLQLLVKARGTLVTHPANLTLFDFIQEYMVPLLEKAKNKKTALLPKEDIDAIFSNADEILAVHQALLADLVHVLEKWPRCHGMRPPLWVRIPN